MRSRLSGRGGVRIHDKRRDGHGGIDEGGRLRAVELQGDKLRIGPVLTEARTGLSRAKSIIVIVQSATRRMR